MLEISSVSELLSKAISILREAEIDTPEFDAKLLLQHACGFSNVQIISRSNEVPSQDVVSNFNLYINRRLKHEPVHRILGYRDFYGREFILSSETLIPRPDTETLVECALNAKPASVLEIGTGSGAIAVSLASELRDVKITATDISKLALDTAHKNAVKHNVDDKIEFIEANLFGGIVGKFDLIISNPPYIPAKDIKYLQKEVQLHDPVCALDGGKDGLNFYRLIFEQAIAFLNENGAVMVEIGIGQEEDVISIAKEQNLTDVRVFKDLNGVSRVINSVAK